MLPFLFSSQYCDRAANHLDERTSSAESDKAQGNILRKMSVRYSSFASKIGCFLCYQSIWFKIDQTVFFMSLHCTALQDNVSTIFAWREIFYFVYCIETLIGAADLGWLHRRFLQRLSTENDRNGGTVAVSGGLSRGITSRLLLDESVSRHIGVMEYVFGIRRSDPRNGIEGSMVIHPHSRFYTGSPLLILMSG